MQTKIKKRRKKDIIRKTFFHVFSTRYRTRTDTRRLDFKSSASTNSAKWVFMVYPGGDLNPQALDPKSNAFTNSATRVLAQLCLQNNYRPNFLLVPIYLMGKISRREKSIKPRHWLLFLTFSYAKSRSGSTLFSEVYFCVN
jgi:hypothetical protein